MDSARRQKQENSRRRDKNQNKSGKFGYTNKCLNGNIDDTISSSDSETSDVESLDERSSSDTDLDILAKAQAHVLKKYKRRRRGLSESSLDSSEDESETSVKTENLTKKSKFKSKRTYSNRGLQTLESDTKLESDMESESDETSSSSVDSDDEKISDSFFEDSSDAETSSDSEEPTITPSVDLKKPSPSKKLPNTCTAPDSDTEGLDQAMGRNMLRSNSVPTLVNHAVGSLRWPFTNLYVKELHVVSDESELEENHQEKETLSNYKTKLPSHSFPSRQKDIMHGRVWTPAWWAVNSGSPSEIVNYKDYNSND